MIFSCAVFVCFIITFSMGVLCTLILPGRLLALILAVLIMVMAYFFFKYKKRGF